MSAAIQTAVEAQVKDFRDTTKPTGNTELTIAWHPLGTSPEVVGVMTDETLSPGASVARIWRSYWYDAATRRVVPNTELADPSALKDEIRTQLAKRSDIDQELLTTALTKDLPLVGFTEKGGLFVGFSQYDIAPGSTGPVSVIIDKARTAELLSAFGKRAQQAAVAPSAPRLPFDPSASPTPTATSTVTTDPEPNAESTATESVTPSTRAAGAAVNCRRLKCVAITYDDGPSGYTDQLLKTLAAKKAKATFFMLGQQVATYPSVAKRVAQGGHEIGVHTWDHKSLPNLAPATMRSEISRTAAIIQQKTGVKPTLSRPPYGATNNTVRAQERAAGLAEILWSIDTLDWKDRNSRIVTQRVLSQTKRGSIVLMHDIHKTTVDAAPAIIDGLQKRGFTLVTVSELLGQTKPGVTYRQGR